MSAGAQSPEGLPWAGGLASPGWLTSLPGLPAGCPRVRTGGANDPAWTPRPFPSPVSSRSHGSAPLEVEEHAYPGRGPPGSRDRSWKLPAKCHNLSAALSVKWDCLPALGGGLEPQVHCEQEVRGKAVGPEPGAHTKRSQETASQVPPPSAPTSAGGTPTG